MTDTALSIERNDGTEEFTLKSNQVKMALSASTTIKAVLSAAGGLAGASPVLAKETYQINLVLKDVEAEDYPNSSTYEDEDVNPHNYGIHSELRRAFKEWGPTVSDGFDTLHYDGRDIDGMITDLQLTENRQEDVSRQYTGMLEWSHVSVYIG